MHEMLRPRRQLPDTGTVRLDLAVCGQVQGVGFRPYVYRLARELGLAGWVANTGDGVRIEVEGEAQAVERFVDGVRRGPAPLASVRDVRLGRIAPRAERDFRILGTRPGAVRTGVTPDTAPCETCLGELFDPADRRYRHPFINCTRCGPRYTITRALPYDRPNTSMGHFAQCGSCAAEYRTPQSRRFHAQPNACPECGPALRVLDAGGTPLASADPVASVSAALLRGDVVAVKGLGGYHLVCDARDADAVAWLRARKRREAKPLAVMVASVASARSLVEVTKGECALLESPERPIVLLPRRPGAPALPGIADGLHRLGVMLPCTPLHYLLFHERAGRPHGLEWLNEAQPSVLVVTSANANGEPIVRDDEEALARLAGVADLFLVHDRGIVVRCDDSVVRADGAATTLVRRARGYTPVPVRLSSALPSVLAFGGLYKNTVCVTRGRDAYLSAHVGDLDNAATCAAQDEAVAHLLEVLAVTPQAVACDRHPDFHSTLAAARFAAERGLPLVQVQHHHAHVAAVAAEHGLEGPVLGVALDGVGLGDDGSAWGGELLRLDAGRCQRVGRLRPLALPGGDRAAREPWRMGASALHELGLGHAIEARFGGAAAAAVAQMLERGSNCPPSSSAGRLFDAAAALLGVRRVNRFEADAAMALEDLTEGVPALHPDPGLWRVDEDLELDLRPLLERLVTGAAPQADAALFHDTLAVAVARWAAAAADRTGITRVALGGGCLLNRRLSLRLDEELRTLELEAFRARQVPPNDGGLSLGQAWVAGLRVAAGGS
jgi:hydrogenase maturation protein HypF